MNVHCTRFEEHFCCLYVIYFPFNFRMLLSFNVWFSLSNLRCCFSSALVGSEILLSIGKHWIKNAQCSACASLGASVNSVTHHTSHFKRCQTKAFQRKNDRMPDKKLLYCVTPFRKLPYRISSSIARKTEKMEIELLAAWSRIQGDKTSKISFAR